MAQGRGTSWEPLLDLIIAQKINAISGGAVIAPWEVPQLDEEWVDILLGAATKAPQLQSEFNKIEQMKQQIRAKHPSFSQRGRRGRIH